MATSARERRMLVRWLRRTTRRAADRDPVRRRRALLLLDRVQAVRETLLAIAAVLEREPDPDPKCILELRQLLGNGCDSPLYNPDLHISELRATLHYVQSALAAPAAAGVDTRRT